MSRLVILYQHSWRLYFHITCLQYIQCIFIILSSCLCLYFHDTCLILLQPKLRGAKGMSYNSFFWPFAINSNPLQVFSFYCPFGKLSFCRAPGQSVYENCHYKSVCATVQKVFLKKIKSMHVWKWHMCISYLTGSSIRCIYPNFRNGKGKDLPAS